MKYTIALSAPNGPNKPDFTDEMEYIAGRIGDFLKDSTVLVDSPDIIDMNMVEFEVDDTNL